MWTSYYMQIYWQSKIYILQPSVYIYMLFQNYIKMMIQYYVCIYIQTAVNLNVKYLKEVNVQ
jgi:hypothetical protein